MMITDKIRKYAESHLRNRQHTDEVHNRRILPAKLAVISTFLILTIFPLYGYFTGNTRAVEVEVSLLAIYTAVFFALRRKYGTVLICQVVLFIVYIGLFVIIFMLRGEHYLPIWVFGFHLYSLVLYGHRAGIVLSTLLFTYTAAVMTYWIGETTTFEEVVRFSGVSLVLLTIGYYYEYSVYRTLTRLNELNISLGTLSKTDDLTGLYNRRYFNEVFSSQIRIHRRHRGFLVFMMLDVDFFKKYNDIYGHQAGDNTLRRVALSMKSSMRRPDDYIFRLGGEEFGILFSVEDRDKIAPLARRIVRAVEELEIEHAGSTVSDYVTISAGVFIIDVDNNMTQHQIYRKCDGALYMAKSQGRNRCVLLFEPCNV